MHDARAASRAGIMHHAEKSYNDQDQSEFNTVRIRYRYRYFGKVHADITGYSISGAARLETHARACAYACERGKVAEGAC